VRALADGVRKGGSALAGEAGSRLKALQVAQ